VQPCYFNEDLGNPSNPDVGDVEDIIAETRSRLPPMRVSLIPDLDADHKDWVRKFEWGEDETRKGGTEAKDHSIEDNSQASDPEDRQDESDDEGDQMAAEAFSIDLARLALEEQQQRKERALNEEARQKQQREEGAEELEYEHEEFDAAHASDEEPPCAVIHVGPALPQTGGDDLGQEDEPQKKKEDVAGWWTEILAEKSTDGSSEQDWADTSISVENMGSSLHSWLCGSQPLQEASSVDVAGDEWFRDQMPGSGAAAVLLSSATEPSQHVKRGKPVWGYLSDGNPFRDSQQLPLPQRPTDSRSENHVGASGGSAEHNDWMVESNPFGDASFDVTRDDWCANNTFSSQAGAAKLEELEGQEFAEDPWADSIPLSNLAPLNNFSEVRQSGDWWSELQTPNTLVSAAPAIGAPSSPPSRPASNRCSIPYHQ